MGIVNRPNTYTAGTKAKSSEVNTDFNTIYNEFNGNIDNDNVKAGAAIAGTKLNLTTVGAIGSTSENTGKFSTLTTTGDVTLSTTAIAQVNESTTNAYLLQQLGILAAENQVLHIVANSGQVNTNANAIFVDWSSGQNTSIPVRIINGGTADSMFIDHNGGSGSGLVIDSEATASNEYGLDVDTSQGAKTARFTQGGAGVTDVVTINNVGSGKNIIDETGQGWTAAGLWQIQNGTQAAPAYSFSTNTAAGVFYHPQSGVAIIDSDSIGFMIKRNNSVAGSTVAIIGNRYMWFDRSGSLHAFSSNPVNMFTDGSQFLFA